MYTVCILNWTPRTHPRPVLHITLEQPTRRLLVLPVTQNMARYPVSTLGTQLSPIFFTPHPQKPQQTAIKPTAQHYLHVTTYLLRSRRTVNSQKLTSLLRLINWTDTVSSSQVTEWVGFKGQHGQPRGWHNQPFRIKALRCNSSWQYDREWRYCMPTYYKCQWF